MGESLKSFEELECWKACRKVHTYVRKLTKKYPAEEKYDLVDNMKRAARSASRNIAEGFGRYSFQENIKHCIISRGSLFELIDDLITSDEELYITKAEFHEARKLIDRAAALVNGYIHYLYNAKIESSKVKEESAPYSIAGSRITDNK